MADLFINAFDSTELYHSSASSLPDRLAAAAAPDNNGVCFDTRRFHSSFQSGSVQYLQQRDEEPGS